MPPRSLLVCPDARLPLQVNLAASWGLAAPPGPSRPLLCHTVCTTTWQWLTCPFACIKIAQPGGLEWLAAAGYPGLDWHTSNTAVGPF
jgi:hypothetical protein